jgi:hypothetical protein
MTLQCLPTVTSLQMRPLRLTDADPLAKATQVLGSRTPQIPVGTIQGGWWANGAGFAALIDACIRGNATLASGKRIRFSSGKW